jgi:hypothetical protein
MSYAFIPELLSDTSKSLIKNLNDHTSMAKSHDQKKEAKKPAAKSLKEKRAEKKAKKSQK